jgi:hypothetical protein
MDSDIFATGDFLSLIEPLLEKYIGVFSCLPLWTNQFILKNTARGIGGDVIITENGLNLGTSFFAIYNNEVLSEFMKTSDVGFRPIVWQEIPPQHQPILRDLGLQKRLYDTGKLLNILLQTEHHEIFFLETDRLHHIGGLSAHVSKKYLSERKHVELLRPENQDKSLEDLSSIKPEEFLVKDRIRVSFYFAKLLDTLFKGERLPQQILVGNQEIDERVAHVVLQLVDLYAEFKDSYL